MSLSPATPAPSLSPAVVALFRRAAQVLKPPPPTSVCQWAERERILSTESSAATGRYRAARAPYQRGMQDAVNEPGVEEIVYFTSAQIGKSLCLENVLGYFMHEDPCPVICMWPSLEVAKSWSVDTLGPMLRDTPALRGLVAEKGRTVANSTLFKKFPGGWLALIGANSPATLRRRRARIILADEVDAYNASAGPEGDPIELVSKRSTTFWNRLRLLSSTPTLKGESRIEAAYEISDRRKFWVPCPHCSQAAGAAEPQPHDFPAPSPGIGAAAECRRCGQHLWDTALTPSCSVKPDGFQLLQFRRLVKDKTPPHDGTAYPCEHCGAALADTDKTWMLAHGEWRAENPAERKRVGFWINEMYSPFVTWAEMAAAFFHATAHRENPELLKTFVNLSLGETWELRDEAIGRGELEGRVEDWDTKFVPRGVAVLTCGVDVQADRIEAEVVGWGRGEESWSIDFARFDGDTAQPDVWQKLDEYLRQPWWHALAPEDLHLEIAATFIDSGFRSAHVYAFTKTRAADRVFASKGVTGFGKPPLGKWNRNNQARVKMYPLAVDVLKELVYSRLRIATAGPGYAHFSRQKNLAENPDYFEQLTAEKIQRKNLRGFPVRFWYLPPGHRNEALDCRAYATAALYSLVERTPVHVMLENLHRALAERAKELLARRKSGADQMKLQLPVEETAAKEPAEIVAEVAARLDAVLTPEASPPAQDGVGTPTETATPAPLSSPPMGPPAPPMERRRSRWL